MSGAPRGITCSLVPLLFVLIFILLAVPQPVAAQIGGVVKTDWLSPGKIFLIIAVVIGYFVFVGMKKRR